VLSHGAAFGGQYGEHRCNEHATDALVAHMLACSGLVCVAATTLCSARTRLQRPVALGIADWARSSSQVILMNLKGKVTRRRLLPRADVYGRNEIDPTQCA
jgi:hypothetical protein